MFGEPPPRQGDLGPTRPRGTRTLARDPDRHPRKLVGAQQIRDGRAVFPVELLSPRSEFGGARQGSPAMRKGLRMDGGWPRQVVPIRRSASPDESVMSAASLGSTGAGGDVPRLERQLEEAMNTPPHPREVQCGGSGRRRSWDRRGRVQGSVVSGEGLMPKRDPGPDHELVRAGRWRSRSFDGSSGWLDRGAHNGRVTAHRNSTWDHWPGGDLPTRSTRPRTATVRKCVQEVRGAVQRVDQPVALERLPATFLADRGKLVGLISNAAIDPVACAKSSSWSAGALLPIR